MTEVKYYSNWQIDRGITTNSGGHYEYLRYADGATNPRYSGCIARREWGKLNGAGNVYDVKQRTRSGGLNEYRFPARDYVPGFPRFTTIDPMCEGTPWLRKV